MIKNLLYGFCLLAFALLADDRDQSQSSLFSGPSYTTDFPALASPVNSTAEFLNWAQANKALLGMSDESDIALKTAITEPNGYSLYRIVQTINGIELFAHQSVLLFLNGQPISAHKTTSALAADAPLSSAEWQSVVEQALQQQQLSYSNALTIKPVYWPLADKLVAAVKVDGQFSFQQSEYPYTLFISASGDILQTLSTRWQFSYQLIDVDQMCSRMFYSQPTTADDLLQLANLYNLDYPPAGSASQASTTASQKLATLFDQVGRFMAEHFGSAQFDPVDNSIVYAFVGSKMFHHQHGASVSCAGSSTNPNAFFAVVSNAFGEELGLVQVHSPLLQNPEVIMHELAHGIIAFSSELVYLGESGALNEAFSDIAGVSFVAWLNNRLAAPEQTDWLIRLVSTVIRDFRFPQRANNNPDHYLERYVGTKNNGGVHINSSIVNHAFYLLAEGGSHRRLGGVEVPKIGMQKALKIWHYATTKIMTPTSDFRNARYAVAEAAEIIYGQYSPERTAVHKAFDAVGIKGSWSENVPPKPVPIPLPEPDIKPQPEPIPAPSPQPKAEVPEVKVPPVTPTPPSAPVAAFSQLHFFIAFAAVMSALGLLLLLKRSRPGHSAQSRYHAYQYAASPTADLAMAARSDAQQAIMHLQTPTQRFELSQSQLQAGVTIGRAAQAVISLAHPAVSSQHLRIFLRGKQLYIQDLGSRYGTSVNGVVLPAHQDMPVELPAKLMLADLDCLLSGTDIIAPRPVAAHVQAAALCWLRLADSQNERTLNSVTLATRPCSLGRADDNDYVIKHPSVSSHHGQIFYQHPNWFYQDLGSSYGSSIESSAQRTTLQPGSPVKLEGAAKLYLADFAIRISIVPTGES